uniref:Syntaxin binding protein 3 n=1 Tax=Scleropages formosus TaxID=113540 RepID=A0A8C9U8T5_SCLFO
MINTHKALCSFSLSHICFAEIKDTIIADCRKSEVWKVCLLLSSCCKMPDLMSEGITIVEDLFKKREPVLEMKAIYFMSPTEKCVDALIGDFKGKPKYKAAYVYFTDYCSDALFNKMKMHCAKSIRVCKEINISFLPKESQVFTCDKPGAFRSIYSIHSQDKEKTLEALADQIVTLCENTSPVDLKHVFGRKPTQTRGQHAQLLIVERGFDPATPILHELTYQAMAYDLLQITNDTYKYKAKDGSEKEALLNEDDELWVRLRHMHIADKTVHLSLTEDCMNQFQSHVEKLCKAEQDLALGADAEGQKVKDPMRTLLPVLLHPHSTYDKIRAVLLYIFSLNGTTEENLNKLIQHVKIENESEFIRNWKDLGVPIISSGTSFFPFRKSSRRERSLEGTYCLSRWTPVIKDVMEDAIEGKLDTREWPHQCEGPSAWNGSGAVSARQKHKPSALDERRSGSRLIVFILGGVSYSEMRCAYQVTQAIKSCEVIIGSSHILTPTGLLDDIQVLSKAPMEKFEILDEKVTA